MDTSFRKWRDSLPVPLQPWMRDSGVLRILVDSILLPLSLPTICQEYPTAVEDFLRLSGVKSDASRRMNNNDKVQLQQFRYGDHASNVIDLVSPQEEEDVTNNMPLIVFVHGGAWGSGFPSMYRLVAAPFVQDQQQVAILGYRTYPDASVPGQVSDVKQALTCLVEKFPNAPMILMGHSSGAHILSLALVTGQLRPEQNGMDNIIGFIGMAGVYDIPSHYNYETQRGEDLVSPLSMACGESLSAWKSNSPTRLLLKSTKISIDDNKRPNQQAVLKQQQLEYWKAQKSKLPILICHGTHDTTVPMSSSVAFVEAWNKALEKTMTTSPRRGASKSTAGELILLDGVEHSEMILQIMFGGPSRDVVRRWIQVQLKQRPEPQSNYYFQ